MRSYPLKTKTMNYRFRPLRLEPVEDRLVPSSFTYSIRDMGVAEPVHEFAVRVGIRMAPDRPVGVHAAGHFPSFAVLVFGVRGYATPVVILHFPKTGEVDKSPFETGPTPHPPAATPSAGGSRETSQPERSVTNPAVDQPTVPPVAESLTRTSSIPFTAATVRLVMSTAGSPVAPATGSNTHPATTTGVSAGVIDRLIRSGSTAPRTLTPVLIGLYDPSDEKAEPDPAVPEPEPIPYPSTTREIPLDRNLVDTLDLVPFIGAVPVDVLPVSASRLLAGLADLTDTNADENRATERWAWLTTGTLAAAGVLATTRPRRRTVTAPAAAADLARWEDHHDAGST